LQDLLGFLFTEVKPGSFLLEILQPFFSSRFGQLYLFQVLSLMRSEQLLPVDIIVVVSMRIPVILWSHYYSVPCGRFLANFFSSFGPFEATCS